MKHKTSMPSQRQLRVGEQIRHIIASTLSRGQFHDDVLLNVTTITVTEVSVSPDLKNATAYIISRGEDPIADVVDALNHSAADFQKDVNRQSNLKFTPRIKFKEDKAFEQASRIDSLLRDINTKD